jgi:rare lipoprotein A
LRRGPIPGRAQRSLLAAVVLGMSAGCAVVETVRGDPDGSTDGLRLSYEDVLAPEVFSRDGVARPEPEESAGGLWAATPGLRRPERAEIENIETGATAEVALFAGGGPGGTIRVSAEAAGAIGLERPGRVRLTALRREPRIAGP